MKKHIGLVFGGGGGKGSYQAGVWKALRESGAEDYIGSVSGTSVGALNGAMFCGRDLDKALEMWKNIRRGDVLAKKEICSLSPMVEKYKLGICANGWFSNTGLRRMIDESVDFGALKNNIHFYATASKLHKRHFFYDYLKKYSGGSMTNKIISVLLVKLLWFESKAEYFNIKNDEEEKIKNILLASSAIPLVFPDIKIEDRIYIDGGVKENIPLSPIYRLGFRKLIVVSMGEKKTLCRLKMRGAKFVHLNLDEPNFIKNLEGTFDFSPENATKRIKKGYEDCMERMDEIFELIQNGEGL